MVCQRHCKKRQKIGKMMMDQLHSLKEKSTSACGFEKLQNINMMSVATKMPSQRTNIRK